MAKARPRRRAATRQRTIKNARRAARAVITIRARIGDGLVEADVRPDPALLRIAHDWTYILRSRTRWADDPEIRHSLRFRALDDLARLGIQRPFMDKLVSARQVEIELHAWDEANAEENQIHEAAADIPWEYLISAGTRGVGRYRSILITRLFRNHGPAGPPAPPGRVLFIESAPGRLEDEYSFELERDRIRAAVGADEKHRGDEAEPGRRTMKISETENLRQLRKTVREAPWNVLHVTGVDTHQAAWLIETLYDEVAGNPAIWNKIAHDGRVCDGMILREANVAELPVSYKELAAALINPKHPPSLVTLNLYYSGARTARELVKQGAQAALGFLDEIDDELAERFFQAFYWAWCRHGGACAIGDAFLEAWKKMTGDRLHGTAIVIWMGQSVFEEAGADSRDEAAATLAAEPRDTMLARLAARPVRELLQVQLERRQEVNYSLLHNDRPLLKRLTLTKLVKEPLEDVTVQVELNLGAQNYPYRCTHMVLDEPQLELAPMICIPLTAALPRSLKERVQSTVYVKVTCGGRVARETTERVTLIPVDEWFDDTDNNPWLPSFVLPRDPAILKIIAASRRYLVGISDNPAAGFDGYQSVDQDDENPIRGVDAQVQAIWTALVNEFRLQYINPPPAYSDRSQRLRTPTDIMASNSGTCIDLALLLASCLEYIDIYPVLVLLEGHAFAGYWRSEEAHAAFEEVRNVPAEVPAAGSARARTAAVRFVDQYRWRLTRLHYDEIMDYITAGHLVMLETTHLTSASSFAETIEEGRTNMRSRREFDSLLDIRLARTAKPPVTPLPIINE